MHHEVILFISTTHPVHFGSGRASVPIKQPREQAMEEHPSTLHLLPAE